VRINGKIRAREVRVIGEDGHQLGVMTLAEAIRLAQSRGVDLVEIAPNATPPVCRVVDFGKFRYEQAKREKEARKHQHANKMKEIQLTPGIDPHDYGVKLAHAIDFLCEDMKVKVSLRFRGREMAHTEFGFQVVRKLIEDLVPFGHPDANPKLVGRGIHLILSPLPRNKRAKNPRVGEAPPIHVDQRPLIEMSDDGEPDQATEEDDSERVPAATPANERFANSPFSSINLKVAE
jgi:translation initiation factor IF-3